VFTIRDASVNEIPVIRQLAEAVWPQTYASILTPAQIGYMMQLIYSEASLQQQMASGHQFILLYEDEVPAGFASFSAYEPGIYKLQKIYVVQRLQGKGAGKFLIDHIITAILRKNARVLRLNVNRFNNAKTFYEKRGFSVIGEEDIAIGNGYYMNDYVMEKQLYKDPE
jgi:diamine N-acetyltransferase